MFMYKQDLAMAYFPHCSNVAQSECRGGLPTLPNQSNVIEDKKTASRLLARDINLTPELLDALRPTGYRPPQKRLSPRQLQILFSFLGEP